MMAELTPPGFEGTYAHDTKPGMLPDAEEPYAGLFFGLFGFTNRASSLIGPNVIAKVQSGYLPTEFVF